MMRVLRRMIRAVSGLSSEGRARPDQTSAKFHLEPMESRILLSTDVVPAALPPPALIQQLDPEPLVTVSLDLLSHLNVDATRLESARAIEIEFQDLPGWTIAETVDSKIRIDSDAAGFGWYVDETPTDNEEFYQAVPELIADVGGPAEGRMDLLTVIVHELGH